MEKHTDTNSLFNCFKRKGRRKTNAWLPRLLALFFITVPVQAFTDGRGLEFLSVPIDTTVRRSSPVWLGCDVSDDPMVGPVTVSWLKDGSELDVSGNRRSVLSNHTLFITAMSGARSDRSDEGLYQCIASSQSGSILSPPARLTVARMTKFSQGPRDLVAYEGERARFSCAISLDSGSGTYEAANDFVRSDFWHPDSSPGIGGGMGYLDVEWLRNDVPLHLDSRMTILPSGSLEISNLALSDEGKYHCHVSSHGRTKVSDSGRLSVKESYSLRDPSVPVFIARPVSRVVFSGTNLTFDCAANGYPEPTITWLKDGETIDMQDLDTRFHLLSPTRSLHISGVTLEDAGAYMCRAENNLDSVDAVAHLTVRVAPHVTRAPPPIVFAKEREDVEINCRVEGVPPPPVTWYKNAELIRHSEYFRLVNGQNLKILGLVSGDAGMYQCFGQNSAGTVQATTRLVLINEESSSTSPPTSRGSLHPTFKRQSPPFTPNDSVPSEPRNVRTLVTGNRYVTLEWHSPERNTDRVNGYLVYYRRKNSDRERVWAVNASPGGDDSFSSSPDEYRTQINKLSPGTTYVMRIAASASLNTDYQSDEAVGGNHIVGDSSPPIEVLTRADLDLPPAPSNLSVVAVSSTELEARWSVSQLEDGSAPILGYKLFYLQVGTTEEHHISLPVTGSSHPSSHLLSHLQQFSAYNVWLVAVNAHGEGNSPREVEAKTYSDVPTEVPQNVRVEPVSSRSLIIHWEPPPLAHQNGIITGYKVRYKDRSGGPGGTSTPDGSRRLLVLNDLNRNAQYSIKIAALTVNGSGPVTPWIHAQTFVNDLDETSVPGKPTNLVANPKSTSVTVRWDPPTSSSSTLVRGYTIGWGKGFPDVHIDELDSSKRRFTVENLQPNTEYVISVRASNNAGMGQPVYEQVNTRPPEPGPEHKLLTPMALKADVMTAFSVALSWTDNTLNINQYIGDRGYYTVRYATYSSAISSSPRYRYLNVSDVTCLIDNLKPATQYEFSVKAVKGNRESPWSLVTTNTTLEAKPSSPPRDVSVSTLRDQPTTVVFNWHAPKQANGRITGYLIYYTTDLNLQWAVEQVNGDRMSTTLNSLNPHTTYYYKVQARNSKGQSPFSPITNFTTLPASSSSLIPSSSTSAEEGGPFSKRSTLIIVIVAVFGVILIVSLVASFLAFIYCRKKPIVDTPRNTGTLKSLKMEPGVTTQPPDLWIHHDRLELKNMDNQNPHSNGGSRPSSPMHTTTLLNGDIEEKSTAYTSTSTLDRRTPYHSTYLSGTSVVTRPESSTNRSNWSDKSEECSSEILPEMSVSNANLAHLQPSIYSEASSGHSNLTENSLMSSEIKHEEADPFKKILEEYKSRKTYQLQLNRNTLAIVNKASPGSVPFRREGWTNRSQGPLRSFRSQGDFLNSSVKRYSLISDKGFTTMKNSKVTERQKYNLSLPRLKKHRSNFGPSPTDNDSTKRHSCKLESDLDINLYSVDSVLNNRSSLHSNSNSYSSDLRPSTASSCSATSPDDAQIAELVSSVNVTPTIKNTVHFFQLPKSVFGVQSCGEAIQKLVQEYSISEDRLVAKVPPDTAGVVSRDSTEVFSLDSDKITSTSGLEKEMIGGDVMSEDETERLINRRSFRPKPFISSVSPDHYLVGGSTSSSVYSDGTIGRMGPQGVQQGGPYCVDTYANAGSLSNHSSSAAPSSPFDTLPPPPPPSLLASLGGGMPSSMGGLECTYSEANHSNTLGKRTHPNAMPPTCGGLRSFTSAHPPPPPIQSAPTTPHPKHYGGLHPPSSPFKKLPPNSSLAGSSAPPIGGRRVLPPIGRVDSLPEEDIPHNGLNFNERGDLIGGVSTEELSQEMANLEGLMKDLSAITANQFS